MVWMTLDEAAEYARVSVNTLRRWMMRGLKFHQPVRKGRVLIRRDDLDEWIASA